MARIAVENNLSDVSQALAQEGHEVVALEGDQVPDCDCCCISGQDENMMGMSDKKTNAPVINCDGKSANDIVEEVNKRFQ
ncbi:YkuS family protein [Alkalibacillus aidingensis]|uniref:YkuS family protein n=1 Tax=Alkalibacillus aidingensis TaxID=2747607 RepID=UPI001660D35D|nr:YkuS family protein [Alkalibacillus aidingensis]